MSLRTMLVGFAALIIFIAFVVGALTFQRGLNQYSERTAVTAVQVRGAALADFFAHALTEEWNYVSGFAQSIDPAMSAEELQLAVDGYRDAGNKVSWAGVVRTDGTVLAATDEMLVGADVSQRPWFQAGLQGPFAGDVHEALLLADLIAPDAPEPLHFIDFAIPLHNAAGQLRGVFGVHINWDWVRQTFTAAAGTLGIDAFLVNRSGEILIATDPEVNAQNAGGLASFRAASLVNRAAFVEQWPDGETYYSFIVSEVGREDLPRFGWTMVVRLDPQYVLGAQRSFSNTMLMGAGSMALAALLALALLFSMTLRPLRDLIDKVSRLSKGEDVGYVPESLRYRETARLANAIVRFQTLLHSGGRK